MVYEHTGFNQENSVKNELDTRIDDSCSKHNLKREKISHRNGKVEIVSQLDIDVPAAFFEALLESKQTIVGNHSTLLSCMQIAAGSCLRGLTEGVMTTYDSKKTQQLVGSSNHALAHKDLPHASVAIDFTSKDLFRTSEQPDVFVIIAKNKEELKKVLNEIYGDDGTNDSGESGWDEQSQLRIQKNQEIYLKRFVNPLDRILLKIKRLNK